MKKRNRKVTSGSAIEMMRRVTTGIRSLIKYSMSAVFSTDTGEHYLYNSGSSREANNGELFSGRHLVLDATQELSIEVPHTLGAEQHSFVGDGILNTGASWDGTTLSSDGTDTTGRIRLYVYMNITISGGEVVLLDTTAINLTGAPEVVSIAAWTTTVFNRLLEVGSNKFEVVFGASQNYMYVDFDPTVGAFSVDLSFSTKQLTTTANTAITYWDATAKEYVQDASIPVSTTYTFTNQSVGEIAPTTKPFDTADIALMNADNQLLGQLALGSTTTGLSLVTADLYGYYPVSELVDAYIYNTTTLQAIPEIDIPILTNNIDQGYTVTASSSHVEAEKYLAFDKDHLTRWLGNTGGVAWIDISRDDNVKTILKRIEISGENGLQTRSPKDFTVEGSNNGVDYTVLATIVGNLCSNISTVLNVYDINNNIAYSKYRLNITSNNGDATFTGLSRLNYYTVPDGYTVPPIVTNYLSTVRTNGDNSTYGMQLVGFKQDSLGLPTAVADANTIEFNGDGRYADTGWIPSQLFSVEAVFYNEANGSTTNNGQIFSGNSVRFGSSPIGSISTIIGTSSNFLPSTTGLHHVVMVFDGANVFHYVDSILKKTEASTVVPGTYPMYLGALNSAGTVVDPMQAPLGQFKVYTTALDQTEVTAAYASAKAIYPSLP